MSHAHSEAELTYQEVKQTIARQQEVLYGKKPEEYEEVTYQDTDQNVKDSEQNLQLLNKVEEDTAQSDVATMLKTGKTVYMDVPVPVPVKTEDTKKYFNKVEEDAMQSATATISKMGRTIDIDIPEPIETEDRKRYFKKVEELAMKNDPLKFIKADIGRTMPSLIEPAYILGISDILTIGMEKYAKNNWQLCDNTDRYKDALLRHILAYLGGEVNDPETSRSHLYHASANLMFLDWFDRNRDD
jgi:hypothetical protein